MAEEKKNEVHKMTLFQACALNTLNMFGTGPFITIPFLFSAGVDYGIPPGPHMMIGYGLAAFACMLDSMVWGELGAMMPFSGGSYVYLREIYGRDGNGRLMAFLFIWQFLLSGPMEIASGFVAMSQYLAYVTENNTYYHHALIAAFSCLICLIALFREMKEVGMITVTLWVGTVLAIAFVLVVGLANFDASNWEAPPKVFRIVKGMDGCEQEDCGFDIKHFIVMLGVAGRIGIYDFTGYYDVCHIGDEVENPVRTIPISCVVTAVIVGIVYFLVYLAVAGALPWDPNKMLPNINKPGFVSLVTGDSDVTGWDDDASNYIISIFCEEYFGRGFAIFFTFVVLYTIFGSCFSLLLGYAAIPYAAAKDGAFFSFFAHEHPTRRGLPDRSLLVVGLLSTLMCFIDLELIVEGMLTTRLVVQFAGQSFGAMKYRSSHPDVERPFKVPCYPIPNIISGVTFLFVFCTTDNYLFNDMTPLLELGIIFLILGYLLYIPYARVAEGGWDSLGSFGKSVEKVGKRMSRMSTTAPKGEVEMPEQAEQKESLKGPDESKEAAATAAV